jgi:hypothetical protein
MRTPRSYPARAAATGRFDLNFPVVTLTFALFFNLPASPAPPRMNDLTRQFRDFFVSLKLTVVLLVLGMILVFAATLDQVNLGIWAVQEKYFRTFIVLWQAGEVPVPVFPGGYFIGGLLMINLIASHFYRFKFSWKKSGIFFTHVGLILLLIGELFTGLWQEDFSMRLEPNIPRNYSESFRDNELAIIDTTDSQFDEVVAIPEAKMLRGGEIQHPKLPFRIAVRDYFPNAALRGRNADPEPGAAARPPPPPSRATKGVGPEAIVTPLPITYKQNERNLPAAFIELLGPEGSLGTWLVAAQLALNPGLPAQRVEVGGRTYTITLRFARSYKPFELTLLKFSHDRYAGTDIPKNFSSQIRLKTPDGQDDREVLIYMNNPLRYDGFTFYQASFDGETVSILQVVRNPSWLFPYVACTLMTLGLLVQFGIHLFAFAGKRRAARPSLA